MDDPGREVEVIRYHLEMRSPEALRPARVNDPAVTVHRIAPCPVGVSRALYHDIGAAYHWRDRDAWSDDALAAYLADPRLSVWELRVGEDRAGFFELHQGDDGAVRIVLLGLLPAFHGRGLGRHLLTTAVEQAWALGATRVHLDTCSLDSPAALPNYLARGFRETRRERYLARLPGRNEAGAG